MNVKTNLKSILSIIYSDIFLDEKQHLLLSMESLSMKILEISTLLSGCLTLSPELTEMEQEQSLLDVKVSSPLSSPFS